MQNRGVARQNDWRGHKRLSGQMGSEGEYAEGKHLESVVFSHKNRLILRFFRVGIVPPTLNRKNR